MANNEILQILIFSIFFGSALAYVHHQQDEGTVILQKLLMNCAVSCSV